MSDLRSKYPEIEEMNQIDGDKKNLSIKKIEHVLKCLNWWNTKIIGDFTKWDFFIIFKMINFYWYSIYV